jgi:hypothetical protein
MIIFQEVLFYLGIIASFGIIGFIILILLISNWNSGFIIEFKTEEGEN